MIPTAHRSSFNTAREGRIGWVKFCEDVPSETTGGDDPKAQAFFAKMESRQGS
jgi:hypothetical protein